MRENDWRQEIQLTPFVFRHTIFWIIITLDLIGIVAKDIFDLEGSPSSIREFCNLPSV